MSHGPWQAATAPCPRGQAESGGSQWEPPRAAGGGRCNAPCQQTLQATGSNPAPESMGVQPQSKGAAFPWGLQERPGRLKAPSAGPAIQQAVLHRSQRELQEAEGFRGSGPVPELAPALNARAAIPLHTSQCTCLLGPWQPFGSRQNQAHLGKGEQDALEIPPWLLAPETGTVAWARVRLLKAGGGQDRKVKTSILCQASRPVTPLYTPVNQHHASCSGLLGCISDQGLKLPTGHQSYQTQASITMSWVTKSTRHT